MSTKTPTSGKPSAQRGVQATMQHKRRVRTAWIAAGIGIVVALALVVAVVATGGGDDSTSSGDFQEVRPVTVTGAPLPPYDSTAAVDPAVGMAAPKIEGTSPGGTAYTIEPGKPTMLVFVAHWCPHCQAEVPRLVTWHHNEQNPEGLDVYAVSTGVDERLDNYPPSEWLVREEWPWPVIADDEANSAMAAYGLQNFPAFVLIGADGQVKFRGTGEIPTDDLDRIIEATLGL